ncbi:FAD-dependent oxidoreductase [candidate division KSB1 bacterium]
MSNRICNGTIVMISLIINDQQVSVENGSTILDAAKKSGIEIPTLCCYNGFKPDTSCMICVVHELKTDSLIPACSMPAEADMHIETDNEKVRESRKDTLDLLLSEHVGDCEAICHRACPANMNIPLMIRQIKENDLENAIITVKNDIALPAVLGRICSAPCEKGCKRKFYDDPVSICFLKKFVADTDLARESQYLPYIKPDSGKKVAIIGAGPTGLSAAYYLIQAGHKCCIYDRNRKPGGMLRYGVSEDILPRSVLDAEIEHILGLGVEFKQEQVLGKDISLNRLRDEYDAVVIAIGTIDPVLFENTEIRLSPRGILVNRKTYETSVPGVFSGGNTISKGKSAIRSSAHGKFIAGSVDQFLTDRTVTGCPGRFNSTLGKFLDGEAEEFIKEAETINRIEPVEGTEKGFSVTDAEKESGRCFHCDCRKLETCRLRQYADEYGADQGRFRIGQRKNFQKIVQHDLINFEPGKCIKCSICIEIAKKAGEKLGLTFINRGFDVQLAVPFNESLDNGLQKAAAECVEACPTAALAWRTDKERTCFGKV